MTAAAVVAAAAGAPAAGAAEVGILGEGDALRAGRRVALDLTVRDPATRWPLDGLAVRAWLRAPLSPGDDCAEATGRLARFGAAPRHALALDGLRLLAPGEDGTLAVVDPRLSLATANLVRVDRLAKDRPPAATVLDPAEAVLWATLPDEDAVLRHNLAAGGTAARATLPGGRPSDLAGPLPDLGEGAVAVGLDGPGAVARLDRDGRETVRRGVGRGPVRLALGAGRLAALAAGDGRLAVLDPWTLEVRGALPLGGPAAALALVDRQDLALVAAGNRLVVVGIGGGTPPSVLAEVRLGVTPDRLAASPDGRWAFALDRARSAVAIVDLARGPRLAHALAFEEGAEELAIGLDLLYVRLRDAPAVAILPFAALERPDRDGTPVVERVTMGAAPTGAAGRSLMAPGPGGRGLWLAHPADRRAYLFTGGAMRAPETAVPLKGSTPAGLLLQPLAPQPRGGGVYRVTLAVPTSPGRYLLAVALDRPVEAHCLDLVVEGGDERDDRAAVASGPVPPPRLEAALAGGAGGAIAGRDTVVVLRAAGTADAGPLAGRALALRAFPLGGGNWQQRVTASPDPAGTAGPGWSARLRFPAPGRYVVLAEALGAGLRYEDAPRLVVEVRAESEGDP